MERGRPVCVTPLQIIDEAIELSYRSNIILCSFGDMLRVPGTSKSLLEAKAEGADVKDIIFLEAVQLAKNNPGKEVIFFAVGFETTAPANALSIIHADKLNILIIQRLVQCSVLLMEASYPMHLQHAYRRFPGCWSCWTIMGMEEYYPIAEKYKTPIVGEMGSSGAESLQGILMAVRQLEGGLYKVENQYARSVMESGNRMAKETINEVFENGRQELAWNWRNTDEWLRSQRKI